MPDEEERRVQTAKAKHNERKTRKSLLSRCKNVAASYPGNARHTVARCRPAKLQGTGLARPVNSESICLSINGIYVANVGGAEPLKRSMGMESVGPIGGHAVSMICFIYTAHFGTWQLL